MYLKRKIWSLEREAQINKTEIGHSAAVAAKAQKELDIAKFEARKLSGEGHQAAEEAGQAGVPEERR